MADNNTLPPDESAVQPGVLLYEMPPPIQGTLTGMDRTRLRSNGTYGDVYRGEWVPAGKRKSTPVAIKLLRPTNLNPNETSRFERRVKRETVIWKAAQHDNILPFLGYQISEKGPALISPWCEHGSLSTYLSRHPELSRSQRLKLLLGAALGLAHLHSRNPPIIHADLKPENIMITDEKEACLTDFGVSRFLVAEGVVSGLTSTGGTAGTLGYQSKELLMDENARPTKMSDVYAFAGLILATVSGKGPFAETRPAGQVILKVIQGRRPVPANHPGLPESDALWTLLDRCWNTDPALRPSMTEVIELV
ncbi:hypothetical protein FRB90_008993, partial [Tulasnella sp. 427]